MRIRTYSDEAVVLARRNYGEADRILSLYTKNHGRIAIVAKGIRRPKSRKRGHLEVFSYVKFQAVGTSGLPLMTEAEVIDNFVEIRKNLKKVSLAYYFMEVIGRTTHEEEPSLEVFNLLLEYLEKLRKEKELKMLRLDFIHRLLTVLGFWPRGTSLPNPDHKLEEIIERQLSSVRVGKSMLK